MLPLVLIWLYGSKRLTSIFLSWEPEAEGSYRQPGTDLAPIVTSATNVLKKC